MKMKLMLLLVFINISGLILPAQTITNVTVKQIGVQVLINYDLITSKPIEISLYVSNDNGQTFVGPLKSIEGEQSINSSGNYTIKWNVLNDQEILYGDIIFKVCADLKFDLITIKDKKKIIKKYKTVRIGNQTWMAENCQEPSDLFQSNNSEWIDKYIGGIHGEGRDNGWCYFNNDIKLQEKYGNLYKGWPSCCPTGWELPDKQDFEILIKKLVGNDSTPTNVYNKLTDENGFNAKFGGYRKADGIFSDFGTIVKFRTHKLSQEYWYNYHGDRALNWNIGKFWTLNISPNNHEVNLASTDQYEGCSVRCIKEDNLSSFNFFGISKSESFFIGEKVPINKIPVDIYVGRYVIPKILIWQQKGEFEKTTEYQNRVNEETRNVKVQALTDEAISIYKIEYAKSFDWNACQISIYDPDNETYLIKSEQLGNFTIPVPIKDAPIFKQNWTKMIIQNVDFYINNNKLVLAKISYKDTENNKIYTFDSKQPTSYSANNITYNFQPIAINVKENNAQNQIKIENKTIVVGNSDVDVNIPISKLKKENIYVVIIGNEDYQSKQQTLNKEVNVEFAENDARKFSEYMIKTFGIPEQNVKLIINATKNEILQYLDWLSQLAKAKDGKAELIFYYAGHGLPDQQNNNEPYLMPVDANGKNLQFAIKLQDIYNILTQNPSKKISVFLDACFSGGARKENLISLRSVRIKPKENEIHGNLVVFASSTGEESSAPYKIKNHGLFTYFLLKKFQETNGDFTYKELSDFLLSEIKEKSLLINQQSQTPQTNGSPNIQGVWEKWTIK